MVELFRLINARLALMDEVAAYKWIHRLPIADAERETNVILAARRDAAQYGLSRQAANFFAAQIEAAKVVQAQWFNIWGPKLEPFPDSVPDLVGEIRPRLLELGEQITAQIALALPGIRSTGRSGLVAIALQELNVRFVDQRSRDLLIDALLAVDYNETVDRTGQQIAAIRARGTLRAGTTGDYAPFSYRTGEGADLAGVDIEIARELAAALGVALELVPTSWPTLSDDLREDTFDLALSGITRTLARQRIGFFSLPYHSGGKTPIARCDDVSRLDTLKEIDQPDVRVIVNPGGTNQRYVDRNLRRASVHVFDDNRTIFGEIVAGRADVMITDAIEVALQTQRYPSLCPTMPGKTLTRASKGIFMPRDLALKEAVDRVIRDLIASGKMAEMFDRHLATAPK